MERYGPAVVTLGEHQAEVFSLPACRLSQQMETFVISQQHFSTILLWLTPLPCPPSDVWEIRNQDLPLNPRQCRPFNLLPPLVLNIMRSVPQWRRLVKSSVLSPPHARDQLIRNKTNAVRLGETKYNSDISGRTEVTPDLLCWAVPGRWSLNILITREMRAGGWAGTQVDNGELSPGPEVKGTIWSGALPPHNMTKYGNNCFPSLGNWIKKYAATTLVNAMWGERC